MATKKTFTWNSGATGATSATGWSSAENASRANKVVQAYLDAAGTSATILVYGSICGGTNNELLDTLTLSGASDGDAYVGENAFDTITLHCTAVTGTIVALVRSTE